MKNASENRKILSDRSFRINARNALFYGPSEVVHLETRDKTTVDHARELLYQAPGIVVVDNRLNKGLTRTCQANPRGYSIYSGLDLRTPADNVRKRAALKSVQIAEHLIKSYM